VDPGGTDAEVEGLPRTPEDQRPLFEGLLVRVQLEEL